MKYEVVISRRAQKQLSTIHPTPRARITEALASLATMPRPSGAIRLVGSQLWRIRVGDYRVLYEIGDELRVVLIEDIGHRREIYRPS